VTDAQALIAPALGAAAQDWSPFVLVAGLLLIGLVADDDGLVNNLPAASLLAARTPPHPFALLVGLNLGPNLFVTGSLAWILWLRAAGPRARARRWPGPPASARWPSRCR
jgi:arsenical pump membrane protein